MINLEIVTGYVPIPKHPRSSEEYGELGESIFKPLSNALVPIRPFYEKIDGCWLWNSLKLVPFGVEPITGDNPQKDTLMYHSVQHQKFRWLCYAAYHDPLPDTFVWIDYGIGHVPGVTAEVIYKFLEEIKRDDFAIPGCWPKGQKFDGYPCWRFCGGLMVVPRRQVESLYLKIREETTHHLVTHRKVTWEVNSLAAIEPLLPVRWYHADHNETMFTNYAKDLK